MPTFLLASLAALELAAFGPQDLPFHGGPRGLSRLGVDRPGVTVQPAQQDQIRILPNGCAYRQLQAPGVPTRWILVLDAPHGVTRAGVTACRGML